MIYYLFYKLFSSFFAQDKCYMPTHLKLKKDWKCFDCNCGK